jgi:hypothetical protein
MFIRLLQGNQQGISAKKITISLQTEKTLNTRTVRPVHPDVFCGSR